MKIQIWSDIACPFCYIGKHHLQQALQQLVSQKQVVQDEIQIEFRSFQLNPYAAKEVTENIYQQLAKKYGMSLEQAKQNTQRIAAQGQALGLAFNFDTLQPVNTLDAHRLIHLAAQQQLMDAMVERLFKAFFSDSLNIADHQVLIQLGTEIGLDSQAIVQMLNSEDYLTQVKADEQAARELEVSSVPFFVFDDKYGVSGAQPIDTFKDIINKIQHEEMEATTATGAACSGDNCEI